MDYLATLQAHIDGALSHLDRELSGIRTGRANPSLVEELAVECYGSTSPLQQLAAIQSPEPRLLVIQPWDPSIIKDIEKAISQSSLGITPVVDGKLIRLPFPAMTEERRQQMAKLVQEKGEEAKVTIRGGREQVLKKLKADDGLSEDVAKVTEKKIQEAIDASHLSISKRLEKKQTEIMTV